MAAELRAGCRCTAGVLAPDSGAVSAPVSVHPDQECGGPPSQWNVRELAHYGADRDAFGAAVSAPGVVLEDSAFQDRSAFFEVLAGDGESELVDQAETINIGDGKSRLGHVEVFQMGSVGTSIFGRPRHLSVHRHANGCYTLICEEPDNQGSGCGLMLGIIALLIGVPLFILVIAISGGEEEEPQASCRPGTMEDDSAIPEEYREALESAAAESGLSVDLLAAQIDAESGWNPDATSPVGAQGIVQFMPQAWDTYGDGGDPFNAQDAIAAMGRYMAAVADEVTDLAGNERELAELSLAAYNAGPGAVQSAGGN